MQDETLKWYALSTFKRDAVNIRDALEQRGIECFVPMAYMPDMDNADEEQISSKAFKPVVSNYVFLRLSPDALFTDPAQQGKVVPVIRIEELQRNLRLMCHQGTMAPVVIPDKEIDDCRRLCDPAYKFSIFSVEGRSATGELKEGQRIVITRGHFKGVEGELMRKKGKYYLVKTIAGIGFSISIRQWNFKRI